MTFNNRDNKLILSKVTSTSSSTSTSPRSLLSHPPFCPIGCLSPGERDLLPAETTKRGVNVGVVVILESRDSQVLLTRRAAHMRTFPGVWVPPGGHIELGETLLEAGLRELQVRLRVVESCVDFSLLTGGDWPGCWGTAGDQ